MAALFTTNPWLNARSSPSSPTASSGLVGEILGRFERKGFKLVGLKQITPAAPWPSSTTASTRSVLFAGLVDFITSGPVVAMVWEGDGVIASARKLIGATKPLEAEPGTIRGDLASTSAATSSTVPTLKPLASRSASGLKL